MAGADADAGMSLLENGAKLKVGRSIFRIGREYNIAAEPDGTAHTLSLWQPPVFGGSGFRVPLISDGLILGHSKCPQTKLVAVQYFEDIDLREPWRLRACCREFQSGVRMDWMA